MENQAIYNSAKLSKSKAWLLFLFFGFHYGLTGQIGKQIFYYLTLGGLGFWSLYLFFTLNGKVKRYNRKKALELGMSTEQMIKDGLL